MNLRPALEKCRPAFITGFGTLGSCSLVRMSRTTTRQVAVTAASPQQQQHGAVQARCWGGTGLQEQDLGLAGTGKEKSLASSLRQSRGESREH